MELARSSSLTANLPIVPEIEPAVRSLKPNPLNGSHQQLDKENSSTKRSEKKETKRDVVAILFGADIFLPIDYVAGALAGDVSILLVTPGEETIPYHFKNVLQKNKIWSVVDLSCIRRNAHNLKGVPISVVKKYSCGMGSSFVESPPATSSEEGGEVGGIPCFFPVAMYQKTCRPRGFVPSLTILQ